MKAIFIGGIILSVCIGLGLIHTAPATAQSVFSCPDNLFADGGFELGPDGGAWDEYSLNAGSPICSIDVCGQGGGTGPYEGDYWVWFGGYYDEEETKKRRVLFCGSTDTSSGFGGDLVLLGLLLSAFAAAPYLRKRQN